MNGEFEEQNHVSISRNKNQNLQKPTKMYPKMQLIFVILLLKKITGVIRSKKGETPDKSFMAMDCRRIEELDDSSFFCAGSRVEREIVHLSKAWYDPVVPRKKRKGQVRGRELGS